MEFVALNAGGLHFFELPPILESLSAALMFAGENAAKDTAVTAFF